MRAAAGEPYVKKFWNPQKKTVPYLPTDCSATGDRLWQRAVGADAYPRHGARKRLGLVKPRIRHRPPLA